MKASRILSAALTMYLMACSALATAATPPKDLSEFGPMREAPATCELDSTYSSVCQDAPEDFARIPGTKLLIASALRGRGGIYVIDTDKPRSTLVWHPAFGKIRFDRAAYPDCPGPADADTDAVYLTHGLALRQSAGGGLTLFAVHHGSRESIEVFSVTLRRGAPELTWTGCVVAPPKTMLNAVVATGDDGFITTNFDYDGPRPVVQYLSMGRDHVTGDVRQWSRRSGWSTLPDTQLPAPNGIVLSRDGKTAFVAAWLQGTLLQIPLDRGLARPAPIELGFRVDNLRWGDDGLLYAAGQGFDSSSHVVSINPATMQVNRLLALRSTAHLSQVTVALPVGNRLWVGFIGSARAVAFPQSKLPILEVAPINR